MNRRPLLLALAALAAVAGWLLWPAPPPDDEALVRALFREAALAAEARRPADAVAGVSEAFQGQGLDRRALKQLVVANALRGAWVSVQLAGEEVTVQGDAATARLLLVLARGGPGTALRDLLPGEASVWRVEARLRREPPGWRVVAATWVEASLAEALAGDAAAPR